MYVSSAYIYIYIYMYIYAYEMYVIIYIYIYIYKTKVGDHSRGQSGGTLYNSYHTEV